MIIGSKYRSGFDNRKNRLRLLGYVLKRGVGKKQ